jgi:hypothetical protein
MLDGFAAIGSKAFSAVRLHCNESTRKCTYSKSTLLPHYKGIPSREFRPTRNCGVVEAVLYFAAEVVGITGAMMTKTLVIRVLLLLFVLIRAVGAELIHGSGPTGNQHGDAVSISASSNQPDVKGTWSGTFISRNAGFEPFTITVVISANSSGHLIGDASLVSRCLDSHRLKVTVTGSNIVLAGNDARGDTVTFSGTIDNTGTLLTLDYTINGSASARCEIDNGTGTMGKR